MSLAVLHDQMRTRLAAATATTKQSNLVSDDAEPATVRKSRKRRVTESAVVSDDEPLPIRATFEPSCSSAFARQIQLTRQRLRRDENIDAALHDLRTSAAGSMAKAPLEYLTEINAAQKVIDQTLGSKSRRKGTSGRLRHSRVKDVRRGRGAASK